MNTEQFAFAALVGVIGLMLVVIAIEVRKAARTYDTMMRDRRKK